MPPSQPRLPSHLYSLALTTVLFLIGCKPAAPQVFPGYIEAEYVHLAAPLPGTLESLHVVRGQSVVSNALIAILEHQAEAATLKEAEHRLAQARARLDDLTKGRRPSEIAALEAQLDQALHALQLSESELIRRQLLYDTRVIPIEELDRARTRRDSDQARIAQLNAEIETAQLGARPDEIRAAEADFEASKATLARTKWAVDQKTLRAPVAGTIHDTLYRTGEWVAAGKPVVSLLPPENVKARFWVPQNRLPDFRPGRTVSLHLDGVVEPFAATVNYVSTQAEFTPPVIYSQTTRAKLVFMIEAAPAPDQTPLLRPGQPIDVRLQP
jgi:HlyD family secretion protein